MTARVPLNGAQRALLEAAWQEAEDLPAADRAEFARTIHDAPVRAEFVALLARAEQAEAFFARLQPLLHDVADAAAQDDAHRTTAVRAEDERTDSLLGQEVGPYRIEERLGEGGMGVVYRAVDRRLHRTVALKFLPSRLSSDEAANERFHLEARAAAALDHPNICNVHEIGRTAEGLAYIAMAYYPGRTLAELLCEGALPLRQALDYCLQMARGLSAAHGLAIIHRDVKPGNVVLTADGTVKLLDFGVARMRDVAGGSSGLTAGTLAYMAPEQLTTNDADERTDLWSLGVVLFEMCTGARPYGGCDTGETVHAIIHGDRLPLTAAGRPLPDGVCAVIDRLLQRNPADRYPHVDALIVDLHALLDEELRPQGGASQELNPRRSRRTRATAAVGAAAVAVIAWLVWSFTRPPGTSRILVADVIQGSDTVAGSLIAERLRQRLPSPRLIVAGRPSLNDALVRMGRDPSLRLTPPIARELAVREGLKAYIHVTVDRVGPAFLVGAILIESETGDHLDHYQTTALNDAELLPAADRLADELRQRFARSLLSIRGAAPLLAVTTDSLPALRHHLQAIQANRNGDFLSGIALEDNAIAIDPQFADAHLVRAFAQEQVGLRAGRSQRDIARAWELRNRLSRHERFSVEADYAWHVDGDLATAVAAVRSAHRAAAELTPGRVMNRRSYGLALMLTNNMLEARDVLEEGRRHTPCPATKSYLVSVLYTLDDRQGAQELLAEAVDQWPKNPLLGMDQAHFLATTGDYRGAHDAAGRLRGAYTLPFALRAEAVFDAVEGRHGEAIEHLEDLVKYHDRQKLTPPAFEAAVVIGRLLLVAGDTADARERVREFMRRHPLASLDPTERPYLTLALFFADAGDPHQARHLMAEYDATVPDRFKGPDRWMQHRVRAALLMADDEPAMALRELHLAARADRIWSTWLDNLLFSMEERPELARVYERVGQPDSAIAVLERYLNARVLYRAEMDALHRADVLQRLARLLEVRGQPQQAQSYRRELASLWRNADQNLKAGWDPAGPPAPARRAAQALPPLVRHP